MMTNKIEEIFFRGVHGWMVQVWVRTEMALVVLVKIFISEIVEKEQNYIGDSPNLGSERKHHSQLYLLSIPTNFPELYEIYRFFESIVTM